MMMMMMMMLITKALLVAKWIELLSVGLTVNSHVPPVVLQAHLSMPDVVTLMMSRHGGADAHSPLERTGWSHHPSPGVSQIRV